jgi:hypothetical protein
MSEAEAKKRGPGRPPIDNPKGHVYGVRIDHETHVASLAARKAGLDVQGHLLTSLRRLLKAKGYLKPTD